MKNLFLFIFLSIITLSLFAQKPKVNNLQRFDNKLIHFGFSLGINSANFSLHRKPYDLATDSLANIDVDGQSGFNLGIITDLHLNQYFDLRFIPTLVFAQRTLNYNFNGSSGRYYKNEQIIESTYLDFPVLLKYRSARLNNFAAYFIAGGKYSIDLASNEDVDNKDIPESIVKLKKNTTAIEVGIGTDFFLPYFKFAIELKMSYGLARCIDKRQYRVIKSGGKSFTKNVLYYVSI